MVQPVRFYFDLVSPYAYLGAVGIERLARRRGLEVDWCPMLLGVSVLKVMGLKAVPDTPLKGPYAAHDWPRFARYLGVTSAPGANVRMQPLAGLRTFVWLKGRDPSLARRFAMAALAAHWGEGRDMSRPEAVAEVAAGLGVERGEVLAAVAHDGVKTALRRAVGEALAAGVFGCPTFAVGGELFWGADRLDQVEHWLATGGW